MNTRRRLQARVLGMAGILMLAVTALHAQETISWWVVGSGGMQDATDDRVFFSATLGQPIISSTQGTGQRTYQGFWVPLFDNPDGGVNSGPEAVTGTTRFQFRNFPNPMSTSTTVAWQLERRSHVTVRLVDMLGRTVADLFDGEQEAGDFSIEWNGRSGTGIPVADGTYILLLSVSNGTGPEMGLETARRTLTILH